MSEPTQAERYLVDRIRAGDADGWALLLDRFQGRLMAFARSRGISDADADDLVQETFIKFLGALPSYRHEASLETYLFMILRRRLVDHLRVRRVAACLAEEQGEDDSPAASAASAAAAASGPPLGAVVAAPDPTASAYARRDEGRDRMRAALAGALDEHIEALKAAGNFRDLKIAEALFYAQLRNKDIARLMGMEEAAIALIKHRALKALRAKVEERTVGGASAASIEAEGAADSLLTEVWEDRRLSCPKRSTVGGYILGTLDPEWQDYVAFHVETLGCRFCRANAEDLRAETKHPPAASALRHRIMQSTAGFFRRA